MPLKTITLDYVRIKLLPNKGQRGRPGKKLMTRAYEIRSSDGKTLYGQVKWRKGLTSAGSGYVFVNARLPHSPFVSSGSVQTADVLEDIARFLRMVIHERKDGARG